MIKQLYSLTLNEILKKYKKKSLIIITVIIFLVGICYPILVKKMTRNISAVYEMSYGFNIGQLQNQLKAVNDKTDLGKVQKSFLNSQLEVQNLLSGVKANPSGWKEEEGNKYLTGLIEIDALNLMKQGVNEAIILGEIPKEVNEKDIQTALETNKDAIQGKINEINKTNNEIKAGIQNDDYLGYLKDDIKNKNKEITDLNKTLDTLNKEEKKDGNVVLIQNQIKEINTQITSLKNDIKVEQYRYDNKIPYTFNNWKSIALLEIQTNTSVVNEKIMTKGEYLSTVNNGISYENYEKVFNHNKEKAENAIKMNWYSLNHNIPPINSATGTRYSIDAGIAIFVIIIAIFGAVIAGGSVSNEFSKGTIRLLLIRPIKRWKILISKVLALLIISYVILIISMIISMISSGVIFGFKDMLEPVIKVVNGNIIEQSYLVNLCSHLFFNSITIIFTICVSFCLSTVARSSAAAVAISIILFIGSFPATLVLIARKCYWVISSPIPYINLPAVPAINGIDSQVLFKSSLGAIELLIISIILIAIALVVFCKRDITN
ncbi:ABC transporter permease subunit [Cetobacterium sp.]|uniref:ABC transporter permease n=1 Tax=Cetobacterium sp. TaxID=2071632 RepID=UPI003F2FD657